MGFNQGGGVLYIFLGGNPIQQQAAYIQESYEDTLIATTLSRAGDFNGDGLDDWMFTSIVDYHWPPPPEGFRVRLSIVSGDPNFGLDVPSDRPSIPREITLGPAFPNPFNSSVTIPITVDYPARDATVSIYNVLGQEVYRFDRLQLPRQTQANLEWPIHDRTTQRIRCVHRHPELASTDAFGKDMLAALNKRINYENACLRCNIISSPRRIVL